MAKLPTRAENFSERYNQIVEMAHLAEHSDVRGCMVIKPYGYAIWERMQQVLDAMFKATGHKNAYFPLFIPKSYLAKEANHVDGFAKECAVVTHYRLKTDPLHGVIVDPEAKLEEELIIRPTSETIIRNTYKKWISSYRDLPILINQRANVVRWEMRTRMFLRTAEFLWQEGHTAHATYDEAEDEAMKMLRVYELFFKTVLAIDPVAGRKSESEKFAGADHTYTLEAYMQDGKALQSCTSHHLWQNFAKAFDVKFKDKNNEEQYVYATSRGASTRMMGGLILSHSDDKGLVLPPLLAPVHVVIVPIFKTQEDLAELQTYIAPLVETLSNHVLGIEFQLDTLCKLNFPVVVDVDTDDQTSPGWKYAEYELRGVPVRIAVGKRDKESGKVEIMRRDTWEKSSIAIHDAPQHCMRLLWAIQQDLLAQNKARREENTVRVNTYDEFKSALDAGKFVLAHRDGTAETEEKIKQECNCVTRCIPFASAQEEWVCVYSGKPSKQRVLFARAY
jgi:prolyl-tRNA synthetase